MGVLVATKAKHSWQAILPEPYQRKEHTMATVYDGKEIAKGSKLPNGQWGWSDFGWHTGSPTTLASCCPEAELAKARQNPSFAEWIGALAGNDGSRQSAAIAENEKRFDARTAEAPKGYTPAASFDTGFARTGLHADE